MQNINIFNRDSFYRKCLVEAIGSFALIFFGTGAIIINSISEGRISHLGVAASFGMIITIFVYIFADISGAHYNPAMSIGFWIAGEFPGKHLLPYILSQIVGGTLGSLLLWIMFEDKAVYMGSTMPVIGVLPSFILEIILTSFLMLVVLMVSHHPGATGLIPAAIVGLTVFLFALVAGPACGASMNPMRSLAPAIFSPEGMRYIWIYISAPIIGAALGVLFFKLFN